MNKQKLVMKYHPAKKEVEFHRFQNDKEVPIRSDSRLITYMKQKGKFVLQDHGNPFFDDIAKAFDGLKSVDIEVITTKLDYEDFVQMTEYYNAGSACKMNPTLLAEVADMNRTFQEVVKHGEEAIGLLQYHKQEMFKIPLENENVKKSAEDFARQIDDEIKNIREKIDSLGDNNVSLCFAGVYSAGKSALINAILGYRILPEAIESKTARMFQISSPGHRENVKIIFDISGTYTEIEWNSENNCFEFAKGPSENDIREEIQNTMNDVKEKQYRQHEQIKELLEKLNECPSPVVSSSIQIKFPVSLDSENVQFTIYDTPGTDSNYKAHQRVLEDALEEQRQSILIFVAKCDGLEGEGNNALLNYLKEAEKKSKTSIDIGRSLFVLNKAEMVSAQERLALQYQEIKAKEDNEFSIKLSDKKLFFTSARYAYAAKAVVNKIATDIDKGFVEGGKALLTIDVVPTSYCYRQNKCATSEFATEKMKERCEAVLEKARADNDSFKILEVCSGIYALESEILIYGEKYASAVKAFAIIDSVDKALAKLSSQANSLRENNKEEISVIENNIRELRETITKAIDDEYHKIELPVKQSLPDAVCKKLGIDSATLQRTLIGNTKNYLDEKIKGWFFGLGKVKFKETDREKTNNKVEQVIDEFTKRFFSQREKLLTEQRDNFMMAVKRTIIENGKISDSAKNIFLNIPDPRISKPRKRDEISSIYDSHKRIEKVLWYTKEILDKDEFLQDIEEKMMHVAKEMTDDYGKDYRNTLDFLLLQIKNIFESNLERYSLYMKAMIEDKEAMIRLGESISGAACALEECQESLDRMIWKEIGHA